MVKKTREFHDNESENISGESIGVAALINFFVPDAAFIRGRRLIEGCAYSSKYGNQVLPPVATRRKLFLIQEKNRDTIVSKFPYLEAAQELDSNKSISPIHARCKNWSCLCILRPTDLEIIEGIHLLVHSEER